MSWASFRLNWHMFWCRLCADSRNGWLYCDIGYRLHKSWWDSCWFS